MRSTITPGKYPNWMYRELKKLADLEEWQDISHDHNSYIDVDEEHKRAVLEFKDDAVVTGALRTLDEYRLRWLIRQLQEAEQGIKKYAESEETE